MPDALLPFTIVTGASTGEGISYLPMTIMKEKRLVEKHAAALGHEVTTRWVRFPKPEPMREALVNGAIAFAAGGVTQLLTTWDMTRTSAKVKGVSSLNAMPLTLVTSNPDVKTISGFTSKDRIALPAVRTSIQAVMLSMASEKAFGRGQADRLERLTVSMSHPDATAALLVGRSHVNAHVSSAPYIYEELAKPGIHKILDSYEVLGAPHTYNAVWTSTRFHSAHPEIVDAYNIALQDALDQIKGDPSAAADLWLKAENIGNISSAQVESIIRDPQNEWTRTPRKFMAFAAFMNQVGLISTKPTDWRDLFFDSVKNLPGD